MSSLAELESELTEAISNVETCQTVLANDPNDEDALSLRAHYEGEVKQLRARIARVKSDQDNVPSPPPPPPPPSDGPVPPPPSVDMVNSPFVDELKTVFNTGDIVMAKYSEDKQWYQASVISKTGSSTDPVYTVKFSGYGNKETKRKFEVRAVENKKRKADGPPVAQPPPAPAPAPASPAPARDGAVISAAPSVDTSLVQKRESSRVNDGPTRMAPEPKKLKGSKALDKAKSSWMDWQKSGPKKASNAGSKKLTKDSQFRTSDLPNAKVGFTGSGKPMQKDQVRTKWTYGQMGHGEDDAE